MKKLVNEIIQKQFSEMLDRGTMPLFEFELKDDEYLIVNIDIGNKGIYFNFDDEYKTSFSNDIFKKGDSYLLKFDPYFDDLDYYLEQISNEITEGYLMSNNLLKQDQ